MKKQIAPTFRAIKKLPLEVSFQQVESWVNEFNFKENFKERKPEKQPVLQIKNWLFRFSNN